MADPEGSSAAAASAEEHEQEHDEKHKDGGGDEEDTGGHFAPIVQLAEVAVTSGEEDEDVVFKIKAKLYRFDREKNEWKERGVGDVKLLQHKDTKKIRLLMRRERTLKICANHAVVPGIKLQEHAGSEKSWVWSAVDFAEGERTDELFAMRFGSIDSAQKFKKAFEDAQESNQKLGGEEASEDKEKEEAAADDEEGDDEEDEKDEKPSEEADAAASALGGLSVKEKAENAAASS